MFFLNMTNVRIDGEENHVKRDIGVERCMLGGFPFLGMNNNFRVSITSNQSIIQKIRQFQDKPTCRRLNVLTQPSRHSCLICHCETDLMRLLMMMRVNRNMFLPDPVDTI